MVQCWVAILLFGGGLLGTADANLMLGKRSGGSLQTSKYTQNMMCRQNHCVNPLFPAFMDRGADVMSAQEKRAWECVENPLVANLTSFCGRVIRYYPFSIPSPDPSEGSTEVESIIKREEAAATKAYVMHLAGLGYDYWDFQKPWDGNPCVKQVWEMSCYTYFPRCNDIDNAKYLRPCMSQCENYLAACNVECCDEGVQCVFQEDLTLADGTTLKQSGYVDHVAPSPMCTGSWSAANRRHGVSLYVGLLLLLAAWRGGLHDLLQLPQFLTSQLAQQFQGQKRPAAGARLLLLGLLALASSTLMGCDVPKISGYLAGGGGSGMKIPGHNVPFWRQADDYSVTYAYTHPVTKQLGFDSCSDPTVSYLHVCGGNGHCAPWEPATSTEENPGVFFCKCNQDWADPECRTQRKSQFRAFLLSLLFGYTGADLAYLGFPWYAGYKMLWSLTSLAVLKIMPGKIGLLMFFWYWVYDVVRIGSGSIYAADFRVANDLPQWSFVNITFCFYAMLGFMTAMAPAFRDIRKRRRLADGATPKDF